MKKEIRKIEFKEILPVSLLYYIDYPIDCGTNDKIVTALLMKNIIININERYSFIKLSSGRECYIFEIVLRVDNINFENFRLRRELKLRIKQLLSKEFHFSNLFKNEIVIVNIKNF